MQSQRFIYSKKQQILKSFGCSINLSANTLKEKFKNRWGFVCKWTNLRLILTVLALHVMVCVDVFRVLWNSTPTKTKGEREENGD